MIRRMGIVLGAVLVLAGCANPRSEAAARAGTELVGIPKEMLYSCAGVPDREQQVGDRERITYVRGSTYSHVEVDNDDIFGLVVVQRLDGEFAELLRQFLRELFGELPGDCSCFGSVLGLRGYGSHLC